MSDEKLMLLGVASAFSFGALAQQWSVPAPQDFDHRCLDGVKQPIWSSSPIVWHSKREV